MDFRTITSMTHEQIAAAVVVDTKKATKAEVVEHLTEACRVITELLSAAGEQNTVILALEAQIAQLRASRERTAPNAAITERGASYSIRDYGRYFKVAVKRGDNVREALAEFRAAHPQYATSNVAVEYVDAH